MPASAFAAEQPANVWQASGRAFIAPLEAHHLDNAAGEALNHLLRRFEEAAIVCEGEPRSRKAFHLVVFGVGLGPHIDALVRETNCYDLILVEPNLEFLYHSLDVYDWAGLFEAMMRKRGRVGIVAAADPEYVADEVVALIRDYNPCSYDGTIFHTHYQSTVFDMAGSFFQKKGPVILAGLGFYEDERTMVRHTKRNVDRRAIVEYRHAKDGVAAAPIFIVGSGPSLDRDLPHIRENAERAVIISCGTALRPLLDAGIRPDFHSEIENTPDVPDIISRVAGEYDVSGVCLFASSTVDPVITELFDRTVFYFREGLASYPIYALTEESSPPLAGISVSTAALAFAHGLGFREIYFLGLDMGTRNPKHTHANAADERAEHAIAYDIPVPGNLGGTVYTMEDLVVGREIMEAAIRKLGRGRAYYNCSDGAMIRGARAKLLRSARFADIAGGKARLLSVIMEGFVTCERAVAGRSGDPEALAAEVDGYCRALTEIVTQAPDFDSKRYLNELMACFDVEVRPGDIRAGIALMVRGTIKIFLTAAEFRLNRVADADRYARAQEIFRQDLLALIERLRETTIEDFRGLAAS